MRNMVSGRGNNRKSRHSAGLSKPMKLNISEIGKTFAGLNPMKKIKLGKVKAKVRKPGFMPLVWYSKGLENDPEDNDDEPEDMSARILKGSRIVTDQFCDSPEGSPVLMKTPVLAGAGTPRQLSTDDIDVTVNSDGSSDSGDIEIDLLQHQDHVVLESCGILTTDSTHVLDSMSKATPGRMTLSMMGADGFNTLQEDMIDRPANPEPPRCPSSRASSLENSRRSPYRSVSLDTEEGGKANKTGKPRLVSKLVTSNNDSSQRPADNNSTPDSGVVVDEKPDISQSTDTTADLPDPGPVVNQSNTTAVNQNSNPSQGAELMLTQPLEQEEDISTNTNDQTNFTDPEGNDPEGVKSQDRSPHPLQQPLMKMSFSEGSIAATYHTDHDDPHNFDPDELEMDSLSHVSPMSRLRGRMPGLTGFPSPQARRKFAQKVARQKRLQSQLRFQGCQTRILLL